MSLSALNAKIRSATNTGYELPIEIGLGVDGERLGAALARVAIDRLFERLKANELSAVQFLGQFAHFSEVGLGLLQEELRLTREGRSPVLVEQFMRRAREAYRAGVLSFMDNGIGAWARLLKPEHVAFARELLPAMLGAHLFPGHPHPFSQAERDDMIQLYADLEVLARANLQERATAA